MPSHQRNLHSVVEQPLLYAFCLTCRRRVILVIRIAIWEVTKFVTTSFEVTCHATIFTFGILGFALGFMFLVVGFSAAVTQSCRTGILFARSRKSIISLSGLLLSFIRNIICCTGDWSWRPWGSLLLILLSVEFLSLG